MRMLQILSIACLALVILLASTADAADAKKPNVLFIISDDLNVSQGCFGHPLVKTPNIDALAKRGVRFDRAYCQFPLCNPSRASLLTGLRPDQTGVVDNAVHLRKKNPDHATLGQLFRNNGYFVARVGKLYHYGVPLQIGTDGLDDKPSWDHVVNPRGQDREVHDKIFSLTPGQFGGTLSWLAVDGKDEEQTDGIGAAEAIKLLQGNKEKEKPFFLAVGFYRPHTPYVAPKKWFEMYPLKDMPVAKVTQEEMKGYPDAAVASRKKEQDKLNDKLTRECLQAYFASISFMDAQVGKVVAELDRLKLADNTIIVFTSDHGYHLGEHTLWQKQSPFEESARVPMIVVAPPGLAKGAAASAGKASPRVVELVDLYPTIADLCGITPPKNLAGKSLRPLIENPQATFKDAAITQVQRGGPRMPFPGYSVRTERWRYMTFDDGRKGECLFDHQNDPKELKNLVSDPAHAATVAEMKKLLAAELQRAERLWK